MLIGDKIVFRVAITIRRAMHGVPRSFPRPMRRSWLTPLTLSLRRRLNIAIRQEFEEQRKLSVVKRLSAEVDGVPELPHMTCTSELPVVVHADLGEVGRERCGGRGRGSGEYWQGFVAALSETQLTFSANVYSSSTVLTPTFVSVGVIAEAAEANGFSGGAPKPTSGTMAEGPLRA